MTTLLASNPAGLAVVASGTYTKNGVNNPTWDLNAYAIPTDVASIISVTPTPSIEQGEAFTLLGNALTGAE
jgi:hypothetical protein